MVKKKGDCTYEFRNAPVIISWATVAMLKNGLGPLGEYYDLVVDSKDEQGLFLTGPRMLEKAFKIALKKIDLEHSQVGFFLSSGNSAPMEWFSEQNSARIFGSWSNPFEALAIGGILIDQGWADTVAVGFFSDRTAEAGNSGIIGQGLCFSLPMGEKSSLKGAGVIILCRTGNGPRITQITCSRVVNLGVTGRQEIETVLAPAAVETIKNHLTDTGRVPLDYQLIFSDNLGTLGRSIVLKLGEIQGIDLSSNYTDCRVLISDAATDSDPRGSACSILVTAGYLVPQLAKGTYQRIFGVGTRIVRLPDDSIGGIGHGIVFEI